MPVAVDQDRTACEGQAPGRTRLVTTFYDLITALHESIEPGEEDLVTAAVVHLLNAGHVKFLVTGPEEGHVCMSKLSRCIALVWHTAHHLIRVSS